MSRMIERAAKAIADKWLEKVDDSTVRIGPPVVARAAILAAIDPADNALVTHIARSLYAHEHRLLDGSPFDRESEDAEMKRYWLNGARAAIEAIRSLAEAPGDE